MIPKVIHYCWFGGKPLPDAYKKYMLSWRKFFPDYKIKLWSEKNFDLNSNRYVREAYQSKKWAFVSDYARFKILCEHGGLYFDTDVEVVADMSKIISAGPFMGMEKTLINGKEQAAVNPGLCMGAEKGHPFCRELLAGYEKRMFIKPSGELDLTTIVEYTTDKLVKKGLVLDEGRGIQKVGGILIYPPEYFCPINYVTREIKTTPNTVSIHHYDGSWMPAKSKLSKKVKEMIGPKMTEKIVGLMSKTKKKEK